MLLKFSIENFSIQKLIKNCNFPLNWILALNPIFSLLIYPLTLSLLPCSYHQSDLNFSSRAVFTQIFFGIVCNILTVYSPVCHNNTMATKNPFVSHETTYAISSNVKIRLTNFSMDLVWNQQSNTKSSNCVFDTIKYMRVCLYVLIFIWCYL